MGKTLKVENHQNHENAKTQKSEKVIKSKSSKKSVKKWPPLKNPKMSPNRAKSTLCEIRAAWSGVFSIPGGTTGPGFKAENDMRGVRRRIFTSFFAFSLFHFITFSLFLIFWFWHFFTFLHFLDFDDFMFLMNFDHFLVLTSFCVDFCV